MNKVGLLLLVFVLMLLFFCGCGKKSVGTIEIEELEIEDFNNIKVIVVSKNTLTIANPGENILSGGEEPIDTVEVSEYFLIDNELIKDFGESVLRNTVPVSKADPIQIHSSSITAYAMDNDGLACFYLFMGPQGVEGMYGGKNDGLDYKIFDYQRVSSSEMYEFIESKGKLVKKADANSIIDKFGDLYEAEGYSFYNRYWRIDKD